MNWVPNDVVLLILSFTPLRDSLAFSSTCKRFHRLCDGPFWRSRCIQHCKNRMLDKCFQRYLGLVPSCSWKELAYCLGFGEKSAGKTGLIRCGCLVGKSLGLHGFGVAYNCEEE